MTPTTALGLSIRLSMFELREKLYSQSVRQGAQLDTVPYMYSCRYCRDVHQVLLCLKRTMRLICINLLETSFDII